MRQTLLVFLFAALALAPARADEDCPLTRMVSLDMLPSSADAVVVENFIGDHPIHMIVDTGAYLTSLTETKATELGLEIQTSSTTYLTGFGGLRLDRFVTISDYRIGHLRAGRMDYTLLPPGFLPPGIGGLLGADFLGNYDVDFDFARGKFNLFSPHHCYGKVGYWTAEPPHAISLSESSNGVHIYAYVQLDGKEARVMIDTGATHTVMSLETAQSRYDIADDDPRLVSVPGPNGTSGAKRFPFRQMSFGDVRVDNPDIILVPDSVAHHSSSDTAMILGLSVLKHLHLYIAYGEHKLYVTDASAHR